LHEKTRNKDKKQLLNTEVPLQTQEEKTQKQNQIGVFWTINPHTSIHLEHVEKEEESI